MEEDVDQLAELFSTGKEASEKLENLYTSLVPYRSMSPMPEMVKTEPFGMPMLQYPEPEPEHELTTKYVKVAKDYYESWNEDVRDLLGKVGKARYKMQFNDPDGRTSVRGIQKLTKNEEELRDVLDDLELHLIELRKIIIDFESSGERAALEINKEVELATYDARTRTIFFADEAIRFNKNAEYSPAICGPMFETPDKLWELKDFQKLWDSLYDYLPDLQKPTDWNKVYDAVKKINSRVEKSTAIPDLFKLTTKSVRLNPKYVTPPKK